MNCNCEGIRVSDVAEEAVPARTQACLDKGIKEAAIIKFSTWDFAVTITCSVQCA